MKMYTIFVWQPYICPHVTPWVEGLLSDSRVKKVFYIIPHIMDDNRKDFGWEKQNMIDDKKINLVVNPDDSKLNELYGIDTLNAIHIYHGMVCFKGMDYYFRYGLNYNIRRFLTTEPPYIFKYPLFLHYIKFFIRDYKYAKYVERVFAIGGELCEEFYSKVYAWKVTPFIYTTKEADSDQLPTSIKDSSNFKLVYVGNISKRKNVKSIIEALHDGGFNNITLDIIGDGDKRMEIESLIEKYNLKSQTRLLGNKNLYEVYDLLKKYDAIILPSLHDGWGAVINEGLMRGCFALVSNHSGAKELIINDKLGYVFSIEQKNLKNILEKCLYNMNTIRASCNYRIKWSKKIEGDIVGKYLLDSIENKKTNTPWKFD